MKSVLLITAIAMTGSVLSEPAQAGPRQTWDRVEDRIDRRESIRDERVDLGPRDVIEDRIDRRESRRDRRGLDGPSRIDRHERRSWWRLWGQHGQ